MLLALQRAYSSFNTSASEALYYSGRIWIASSCRERACFSGRLKKEEQTKKKRLTGKKGEAGKNKGTET